MLNDEPTQEMIETKQLIEKLEGMERTLKTAAEERVERHKLNNVIHGALGTLAKHTMEIGAKTDVQDQVLNQIREAVARIEGCLLGDSQYQRSGLIAEVASVKADQKVMVTRIDTLEQMVAFRTRSAIIVFSVIGAIGGLVTWLKGTGVVKFFTQ